MSKIPKLPISTKENRPTILNGRPTSRILAKTLSDTDKKLLILNHTKPIGRNGVTTTLPAPRVKRAASVPVAAAGPSAKTSSKTNLNPKIPPYDYKARFQDLLEKHKVLKSEYSDLKEKHVETAEDYEKVKEALQSTNTEKDIIREKLLNTIKDLKDRTSELQNLKIDYDITKHAYEELQNKIKILNEVANNLKQKSLEYDHLDKEYNDLSQRHKSLQEETDALQNILALMYKDQRILRNTVQDLKGNIRVYCRIRPPLETEKSKPLFSLNVLDACSIEVEKTELLSSAKKGKSQHSFTFDGIFTPHATQEDVFTQVSSMIQSALDGYNVCIFAYGQTGSGKTYTMEGSCGKENYGIIPRSIDMIFSCMEDLKRMGWELTVKANFLEIYNEVIYDLLDSNKEQDSHDIKMVNSKGTDVYVSNLKEEEVASAHDFIRLLMFAQRNRQTAATLNNERSSRSHSVAQIKIAAINETRKEKFTSNLNLVDLAGSESGKTTQRMDETKHINRSLSELSKVILSLQTHQSHIPYRNSKLTHLLMPSLGGNSKTLMLVNINQFDECFGETLNSLRFATKVNSCRTTKAKKNLTMVDNF
ncbi:PREDICTED: protein claret segregational-like [Papilio xuthus]|uniref:Protein claret segregational-like n=1 Tax=Papilio xuthus TaxID=66420 RepID=A0AAJ6ZX61_PAPXU|nr:PREDICTED: protein claret segregational-like [Papilio xuthus]